MVCQLKPFVHSLGLNNPPCICLAPRKSRVKNVLCNKQGNCRCKMAVLEFAHLLSSEVKCRGLPLQENRSQVDCGLPSSTLRLPGIHAVRSRLWQSALKLILLSVAIRSTVILFVTIHGVHLSAELSKTLNSISCHFTSRFPLFEASYLFAARL
jgi:hypothetical protein